jgi:type I restriction enzyme M protein
MSEELLQRDLINNPEKIGEWDYYNIGSTSVNALKSHKIIKEKDYGTLARKKPDGLIVINQQVIAIIEHKKPTALVTEKQIQQAVEQEIDVAKKLGAKLYIVTDKVDKTVWINPLNKEIIKDTKGMPLKTMFDPKGETIPKLMQSIIDSIDENNSIIKMPEFKDPLPLAEKVWQDLWSVSGATPENCLYTFVEIFIFKYLSDLNVLQGIYNFNNLIEQYEHNSDNEVLEFYADTVRKKIKTLFPKNEKDNTTIINGTIFVSKDDKAVKGYSSVFKKILLRFRDFGGLENIDFDFKSKLFETFLKESISKKNWGQFFTPLKVVQSTIQMVDIKEGMTICDPACGVGKFLLEPIQKEVERFYKIEKGKIIPKITIEGFDKGFDKDEQKTIILAKANMLIYMSSLIRNNPGITEEFSKLFNQSFVLQTNSILGTLSKPVKEKYDLILTNPPYVTSGSSNLKEEIRKDGDLEKYYSINATGIEGLFMEWIVRSLKPDGKAIIVVPDGVMFRNNDQKLRNFIYEECIIDAVISLPLNTFFTTNKKTYIMLITKKVDKSTIQDTPVFTYLASEIGETRDINRFEIDENHLQEAVNLYNMFKGSRKHFTPTDARCKIQSINKFIDESHWQVDKWWSHDEKVNLGIVEEENLMQLRDFSSHIGDISNELIEYQELIDELIEKKKDDLKFSRVKIKNIMFSPPTNSGLKRKDVYLEKKPNTIPVYSASKTENLIFGYVDKGSKWKIYSNVLTWNKDGSLGVFYRKEEFVPYEKVKILEVLPEFKESLDYSYLKYALLTEMVKLGFDYSNKGTMQKILEIEVNVPIDKNNSFCIETQKELLQRYTVIEELRSNIVSTIDSFKKIRVKIDHDSTLTKTFKLTELFKCQRGFSRYTKKYGNLNKGEYPVYSASNSAPLTFINSYDYDGQYLTWATNGFAGYTTIIDGKFSINADRGILIPLVDDIENSYFKYILEPLLREMASGRKGEQGQDEFTKVPPSMLENVSIEVPILNNDELDIETQRQIAKTYKSVDTIKAGLLKKFENLLMVNVDVL